MASPRGLRGLRRRSPLRRCCGYLCSFGLNKPTRLASTGPHAQRNPHCQSACQEATLDRGQACPSCRKAPARRHRRQTSSESRAPAALNAARVVRRRRRGRGPIRCGEDELPRHHDLPPALEPSPVSDATSLLPAFSIISTRSLSPALTMWSRIACSARSGSNARIAVNMGRCASTSPTASES